MPTKSAGETAWNNGYAAAVEGAGLFECPYLHIKAGFYRHRWLRGWLVGFMKDKSVYFECDQCGEEKMTIDCINGQDVFTCESCGFTVKNYQSV